MTALAKDRNSPELIGQQSSHPMAAAVKAFTGGLAVLDSSGNCKPGVTATGLKAIGRFEEQVDNSAGIAGDLNVRVKSGTFRFDNSASTDEITRAEIGSNCFIVDDQTVAKTSDTNSRSIAGRVYDVDATGVYVAVGMTVNNAPAGSLLSANNLDDLGSAATARGNLGVASFELQARIVDLVGANTAVYQVVAPRAGTIAKIWSVLEAALATGNATVTASINGTPVTTGVITITQSGSAAGDVDSCEPSAANVVAAGDVIEFTVGGTNDDTDATAAITVSLTI